MSFWYQPKLEDIDLEKTPRGDVLNIHLGSDNQGNIWAEVKVEDIEKIINQNRNAKKTETKKE